MDIASKTEAPAAEPRVRPVRAALMQKLCGDGLFALGLSVARVVQLAASDDGGTQTLAYYVLSDAALTQKILSLANTPTYRTPGGAPVTTISRAISLLGFENVKISALAMLLVDTLSNGKQARSVRVELEAALCASLVGRELAHLSFGAGAEEASISALFKNIGPLLIASQEHERFAEIGALLAAGHSPAQASQMILGCTFDTLSGAVLREWKIPELIIRAQSPLLAGVQKAAVNRQEWLRQVASFSIEAARLLAPDGERAPSGAQLAGSAPARALQQRFGAALGVEPEQMATLFDTVQQEMLALLQNMDLKQLAPAAPAAAAPAAVRLLAALDSKPVAPRLRAALPSGKPNNARELLAAGVHDLTQMRLAGRSKVNELIQAALETLYRSMGFRFATACLKDVKGGQYRARLAFGEHSAERQGGFAFSLVPQNDLFHLAMEKNTDLIIGEAAGPRVRALLPDWHRALLPDTRSMVVLPLVARSIQLGLFYADRTEPAPEGMTAEETALLAELKAQVLAALMP